MPQKGIWGSNPHLSAMKFEQVPKGTCFFIIRDPLLGIRTDEVEFR